MMRIESLLPMALLLASVGCTTAPEPAADLVLRGGSVITVAAGQPRAEALAVRGERIVAIGTLAEIEPLIADTTTVIDLAGGVAVPGFVDSHAHLLGIGRARVQLDLREARSWSQVIEASRAAAAEAGPGVLVLGRGWHQDKFDEPLTDPVDGWPRHDALSAATPDNPVVLEHASGHATFANAAAMTAAGVDRRTPDPAGGTIVRDSQGEAVGIFVETAAALLPEPAVADVERLALLGQQEVLENGITTLVDAGSSVATARELVRLADEGTLVVRLSVMLADTNEALRAALPALRVVDHRGVLTVRAIKHWADGALGSRGAWLLEPYSDQPATSGLETNPLETIRESAQIALEHDLQLCVHAIGDRANREILDLYQQSFEGVDDRGRDRRWRIEHAQHLDPVDIPRFGELGVIASMQGIHCTSDGPWVPQRIGTERAASGAYAWRALLDSGARIANGTDAPVERVSPIASFAASVTRRMPSGERFYPDQGMTREEALRSYTLDGAYATFAEADRGSLEVGKLADVTILDRDLLTVPDDQLSAVEVVATIVGGKVVHRRGPTGP